MGGVDFHTDKRLGLLGGTFDPPHVGHLWLAESARDQLDLDGVLFLPVGQPPHKPDQPITAVSHRLSMLQTTLTHAPRFHLDTTDIDRKPPHTTYTLLPLLQQCYPDAAFWLLMGSDSLRDLPDWHQPQTLIKQCRMAVLPRPGAEVDWSTLETTVPGVTAVVDLLEGPVLGLSSTELRRWARQGHSLRHLVAPPVADYIQQQALYTD